MRILSPIFILRIGILDGARIGGLLIADHYLRLKTAGFYKKRYLDLWCFNTNYSLAICNQQWLKMWSNRLIIAPHWCSRIIVMFRNINKLIPGWELHEISVLPGGLSEQNHIVESAKLCSEPLINFSKEEDEIGSQGLCDLGVPPNSDFICFNNRDSSYLEKMYPGRDWSYHEFRDSDIYNYLESAQKMTERGYYAIRMGEIVKNKIDINNPNIIDYSTNGKRSDFLDIYLPSKCNFMICSEGGLLTVPFVFRKPIVWVNIVLIWAFHLSAFGVLITKKFLSNRDKRYLTFNEIFKLGPFSKGTDLSQKDIIVIENTSEEILDATVEMDERLRGNWETTSEDEELQKRFWEIFGANKSKNKDLYIGSKFLRENQNLLN